MKKTRKLLMLIGCALAVIAVSVGATLAYLTDTEAVTNTFTVGHVDITLDEAPVNTDGKKTAGDRVKDNTYHLIPGKQYDKDPTVHVGAGSEDSWIFVKVENGIAAIEAAENTIAAQITTNGWTKLEGVDNVYYKKHNQSATSQDYQVFANFTIDGDTVDNAEIAEYAGETIKVTAYAIQATSFDTALAAWQAGNDGGWTEYTHPTNP